MRALVAAGFWLDTPVPQAFCVQDPVVLVALLAVAIPRRGRGGRQQRCIVRPSGG